MVHIKKQRHGLNKQSDTDLLPMSYLPILNLLPPSLIPSVIPPFLIFFSFLLCHLSAWYSFYLHTQNCYTRSTDRL